MATKRRKIKHRRTKKHYRRKTKHKKKKHRKRHKKTKRRRMHGGRPGISITSPLQPFGGKWGGKMAAFPPGPMYSPGVVDDAKFYGKLNMPIYPDPINTHGTGVKTRGGGKSRRGGVSDWKNDIRHKSHRGGKKPWNAFNERGGWAVPSGGGNCGRKHKRSKQGRRKRGGNMTHFLSNNMPGFSDALGVYWKGGEIAKNAYNTYFGYEPSQNTSVVSQPIGDNKEVAPPPIVDIPQKLESGAFLAQKFNVA
jgi:hypothetical protein